MTIICYQATLVAPPLPHLAIEPWLGSCDKGYGAAVLQCLYSSKVGLLEGFVGEALIPEVEPHVPHGCLVILTEIS